MRWIDNRNTLFWNNKKLSPSININTYSKWYTTHWLTHPSGNNYFFEEQHIIWDAPIWSWVLAIFVYYFTFPLQLPHPVLGKLPEDMVKDKLLISFDPWIDWLQRTIFMYSGLSDHYVPESGLKCRFSKAKLSQLWIFQNVYIYQSSLVWYLIMAFITLFWLLLCISNTLVEVL